MVRKKLKSHTKDIPSSSRLLTISEVAHIIHVHPNTVRQWSNSGRLKCYRFGARRDRRFKLQDIHEFISDNEQHPI